MRHEIDDAAEALLEPLHKMTGLTWRVEPIESGYEQSFWREIRCNANDIGFAMHGAGTHWDFSPCAPKDCRQYMSSHRDHVHTKCAKGRTPRSMLAQLERVMWGSMVKLITDAREEQQRTDRAVKEAQRAVAVLVEAGGEGWEARNYNGFRPDGTTREAGYYSGDHTHMEAKIYTYARETPEVDFKLDNVPWEFAVFMVRCWKSWNEIGRPKLENAGIEKGEADGVR